MRSLDSKRSYLFPRFLWSKLEVIKVLYLKINFLKLYQGKWIFNNQLLQDVFSIACGYYACYFILEIQNNSLGDVLKIFTEDLENNDNFVIKYVDKIKLIVYLYVRFICLTKVH